MIEITKMEPINSITSTLVCPQLSAFRDFSLFIVFAIEEFCKFNKCCLHFL